MAFLQELYGLHFGKHVLSALEACIHQQNWKRQTTDFNTQAGEQAFCGRVDISRVLGGSLIAFLFILHGFATSCVVTLVDCTSRENTFYPKYTCLTYLSNDCASHHFSKLYPSPSWSACMHILRWCASVVPQRLPKYCSISTTHTIHLTESHANPNCLVGCYS